MKNIFDLKDRSDIPDDVYLHIPEKSVRANTFSERIYELFLEAKQLNLSSLSIGQVTIAYYRKYSKPNDESYKRVYEIGTKLASMVRNNEYLKRVDKGRYGLKGVNNE